MTQGMNEVFLPPDYNPREEEEYMSDVMLMHFRKKLLAWRRMLVEETIETIHNMQSNVTEEADITDRASSETDRAIELRTRDRSRKLISKIDEALQRIDDGSYGYCEETGEPIGVARLEARPIATLCVEAQERHEKAERTQVDYRV